MPNINIDDAYILNETGAQVDKVTGLFTKDEGTTSGEKAFAQLNIGAAGSNRNLLDNPWFTVRQRGDGPFTGTSIHSADRWKSTGGNPTVNLLSPYGIQIVNTTNSNIDQYLSYTKEDLDGKTVTLSVLSDDGITSGTGTFDASSNSYTITFTFGSGKWYCRFGYFSSVHARPFIRIANVTANESTSVNIYAIKLELGSVSTLANDAPPKYEQALLDCEYRCVVYDLPTNTLLCRGIATSTTNIAGVIDLPRDMAEDKTPTVSITGSLTTPAGNTITAVSAATYARKNKLRVNFTGTGFTGGTVYDIFTGTSTPKITISADL